MKILRSWLFLLLLLLPTLAAAQVVYPPAGGGITAGTSTITGGTDTRLIFNDGGVWGEDAGLTFNKTTNVVTTSGANISVGGFTLTPFGNTTLPVFSQQVTFAGFTAPRTVTFPDAAITVARTDAANTFTGTQTITQIDLGNTDTSVTRVSGGVVAIEGATIATLSTAQTFTAAQTFPVGSAAAPPIKFTGFTTGIYHASALNAAWDGVAFAAAGVNAGRIDAQGVELGTGSYNVSGGGKVAIGTNAQVGSNNGIAIGSSSSSSGNPSVAIGTSATAGAYEVTVGTGAANASARSVIIGAGVFTSTAPANITIFGQSGSGTNIAGASLIHAGGRGTGTGSAGDVAVQTAVVGTTGSTIQVLGDRGRTFGKYTTLTETVATVYATVAVATGTVAGGDVLITVEANDATDFQARTLTAPWSAANKAGTIAVAIGTPVEAVAPSTGTLTCTLTIADATAGVVNLLANCTSSLTQTVLRANAIVRKNFGVGAITAQ